MSPDRGEQSLSDEDKIHIWWPGERSNNDFNLENGVMGRLLRPISGNTELGTINDLQGLIQGFESSAR